jgi:hypothetical protein
MNDNAPTSLEETLLSVWRQALSENANLVEIAGRRFPVRRTSRLRLRQVDFELGGAAMRGIEQNPGTRSRWARLAGDGAKVMQFTAGGRFFANVADGKLTLYENAAEPRTPPSNPTAKE